MVLDVKKFESARHISSLKQAVVRRGHPTYFGIQENVEHRINDVSYLLLPAVVIDDDLIKSLKIFQIVAHKTTYRFGHSTYQSIVTYDLALFEDECLVADVAKPHKIQQVAEKFSSLWEIEMLIVFLATDERCRVNCMMCIEAHLNDMPFKVGHLIVNAVRLVVKLERQDVVRSMDFIGAEVARLIYEHA